MNWVGHLKQKEKADKKKTFEEKTSEWKLKGLRILFLLPFVDVRTEERRCNLRETVQGAQNKVERETCRGNSCWDILNSTRRILGWGSDREGGRKRAETRETFGTRLLTPS
mmetsp:Transcript_14369/g.28914  ORF Transcript_14369/g.28914 Transcript_14369/m.28914 type:complete len:111 (+) Transcript_14369:375-707(+)